MKMMTNGYIKVTIIQTSMTLMYVDSGIELNTEMKREAKVISVVEFTAIIPENISILSNMIWDNWKKILTDLTNA